MLYSQFVLPEDPLLDSQFFNTPYLSEPSSMDSRPPPSSPRTRRAMLQWRYLCADDIASTMMTTVEGKQTFLGAVQELAREHGHTCLRASCYCTHSPEDGDPTVELLEYVKEDLKIIKGTLRRKLFAPPLTTIKLLEIWAKMEEQGGKMVGPEPAATRLEYEKAKAASFGLVKDEDWLTNGPIGYPSGSNGPIPHDKAETFWQEYHEKLTRGLVRTKDGKKSDDIMDQVKSEAAEVSSRSTTLERCTNSWGRRLESAGKLFIDLNKGTIHGKATSTNKSKLSTRKDKVEVCADTKPSKRRASSPVEQTPPHKYPRTVKTEDEDS